MADTVYVVARKGVNYRHELAGVFTTRADAEQCAVRCIEHENDDYHTYEVVALPLGRGPAELVHAERLCVPFVEQIPPVAVVYRDATLGVCVERSITPIPW